MARKKEIKVVDGIRYEIGQLSVTISLKMLNRFGKSAGGAIGEILNGFIRKDKGVDLEKALVSLFSNLNEQDMVEIPKIFFANTFAPDYTGPFSGRCLGDDSLFEEYFDGKVFHLFKLLAAVLEVQYDDFLGQNGVIRGFLQKATSTQESST